MQPKSIVCFSANDWSDIPSSKLHIMKHLGEVHKVLYIETLGIRNPKLSSSRDLKRAFAKLKKGCSGLRNVETNIYVWSPLAIPFHGSSLARWFNSRSVAWMIKRFMKRLAMDDFIVWSYLPNAIDVIDQLPPAKLIYHCIDDYAEFTDVPKLAFEEMERRMLRKADLTVVSAKRLYEKKRPIAREIAYIPHGVNIDEFRACLAQPAVLEDLVGIKGPIAGFVGRIADWIDLELVRKAAQELPHWSFVLVGPSNVDLEAYLKVPNIHFLGKKDFRQVPHYIQHFDVCLMPFVDNALVASVNPLKMYEYLAIGKPVVSVPMTEIADFAHLLTIAEPRAFSKAIQTAFDTDTDTQRMLRIQSVSGRSWGDVAERILGLVA